MDRIWQWAWDRYGSRYSWAVFTISVPLLLSIFIIAAFLVVAFEHSDRYIAAAVVTVITVLVLQGLSILPGCSLIRSAERWASGDNANRAEALADTYTYSRRTFPRSVGASALCSAVLLTVVAAIAGASGERLIEYAILGSVVGIEPQLIAGHSAIEAAVRPARVALTRDTDIGDSLPRSRPTFATWSNTSVLAVAFAFALVGALFGAVLDAASRIPLVAVAIAGAMLLTQAVPVTVGVGYAPSLRPIRDLAEGTKRVAAGDYSRRLPVVQDDDLGALAASFNRMQAGLAERQRLQVAFGTYVDPRLAARLLEQGDDVFTGERRDVTVVFVDIRDFTPFAEANTAEDTVTRLNALFEIVVPAVVDAGGHVNKFLGDGALAAFGAPNDLPDHADAAVNAAVLIHRRVTERFGGTLRIGIGINTGTVIAGTIGAAGKLEFTLIGDTVNVAARVEQLTKTTHDVILVTRETLQAMTSQPLVLFDRGSHALKGKLAPVEVFGLDPV